MGIFPVHLHMGQGTQGFNNFVPFGLEFAQTLTDAGVFRLNHRDGIQLNNDCGDFLRTKVILAVELSELKGRSRPGRGANAGHRKHQSQRHK